MSKDEGIVRVEIFKLLLAHRSSRTCIPISRTHSVGPRNGFSSFSSVKKDVLSFHHDETIASK